jgi:transposase-like protein
VRNATLWRALLPGATFKGIAVDLGISRGTLKEWVDKLGSGTVAARTTLTPAPWRSGSQAARIARLEAELAESQAEQRKHDPGSLREPRTNRRGPRPRHQLIPIAIEKPQRHSRRIRHNQSSQTTNHLGAKDTRH